MRVPKRCRLLSRWFNRLLSAQEGHGNPAHRGKAGRQQTNITRIEIALLSFLVVANVSHFLKTTRPLIRKLLCWREIQKLETSKEDNNHAYLCSCSCNPANATHGPPPPPPCFATLRCDLWCRHHMRDLAPTSRLCRAHTRTPGPAARRTLRSGIKALLLPGGLSCFCSCLRVVFVSPVWTCPWGPCLSGTITSVNSLIGNL